MENYSVISYSFCNANIVGINQNNVFLPEYAELAICGLIHLFVTLLSVMSELVNESAVLVEVWKNERDFRRTERSLVAVEQGTFK